MNTKYSDLINQTYYFPQEEFTLNKDNLQFQYRFNEIGGTIRNSIKVYLFTSNL
jgi:hypothetical protein